MVVSTLGIEWICGINWMSCHTSFQILSFNKQVLTFKSKILLLFYIIRRFLAENDPA